jgi:hypothetical protein
MPTKNPPPPVDAQGEAESETKRTSVMVATPMYGGMCTGNYVQGLLSTANNLRQRGVDMYWTQLSNESLIPRARNELARLFMASGLDYLMFIDADIGFDGAAVGMLIDTGKPLVCGIYPKKEINWPVVAAAATDGRSAASLRDYSGSFVFNLPSQAPAETDESGLIEVRHGGTGFMLIARRVFEELEPHVPKFRVGYIPGASDAEQFPITSEYFATSIDGNGALLSEDYHFCETWRKHGGQVHANPFIKLEHVGTYVFGGDIIKSNTVRNES